MAGLRLVVCLLALALGAQARSLKSDAPLKVGIYAYTEDSPLGNPGSNGTWTGYEPDLLRAMAEKAGLTLEFVELSALPERISALQSGAVDIAAGGFSVTPERAALVEFVEPYYYSAGVTLFAPNGTLDGVTSWADLKDAVVATRLGYYGNSAVADYGVKFINATDPAEAEALIQAGEAIAWLDDSSVYMGDLAPVKALTPLLPSPYAFAVKLGNDDLADKLSDAFKALLVGGKDAPVLVIEKDTMGSVGFPPNADLAALVLDPTADTLLTTEVEAATD